MSLTPPTQFHDMNIDAGIDPADLSHIEPNLTNSASALREHGRPIPSAVLAAPGSKTVSGGANFIDAKLILETYAKIGVGDVVADFGCGAAAYYSIQAAKLVGARGKVYAIDVVKELLEVIKRRCIDEGVFNVEPIWTDLEMYNATNLPDNCVDVGLAINLFFQSQKRSDMFFEIHRLIKPGGRLVIVDWLPETDNMGPPKEQRVKKEELIAIATKRGYILEREFVPGDYHFGLVFINS